MRRAGTYFDKNGDLMTPLNLKFGGQLKPPLKPGPWFLWIFLTAKSKKKDFDSWLKPLGSRSTIWRYKKELKEKGYI